MDAIARRRGSLTGDTTGVRDGVVEAPNVLVVGLTNRPELIDEALLRPGRLEVQLSVELPDERGRTQILNIHTKRMRDAGGLAESAQLMLDSGALAQRTEYFSGA